MSLEMVGDNAQAAVLVASNLLAWEDGTWHRRSQVMVGTGLDVHAVHRTLKWLQEIGLVKLVSGGYWVVTNRQALEALHGMLTSPPRIGW